MNVILFFLLGLLATSHALPTGFQIGDQNIRWSLNCDMVGPDIASQQGPGASCGNFCNANK